MIKMVITFLEQSPGQGDCVIAKSTGALIKPHKDLRNKFKIS